MLERQVWPAQRQVVGDSPPVEIDRRQCLRCRQVVRHKGVGAEPHRRVQIHARRCIDRLERRIKGNPRLADGAEPDTPIVAVGHVGLDPGMLDLERTNRPALQDRPERNARAREDLRGTTGGAHACPGQRLRSRQSDHTAHVAGGNPAGPQQRDQQAGLVRIVAAQLPERFGGVLHRAVVELAAHVVLDELKNGDWTLRERRGLGAYFRRELGVGRVGKIGGQWRRQRYGQVRRRDGRAETWRDLRERE